MSKQTIHILTDDMDGGTTDVQTVRLWVPYEHGKAYGSNMPSTSYEIDLSKENRDVLRDVLAPFIEKAHRVGGYDPDALRPGEGPKIRAWAEKQKIVLKPKGRIPKDIVHQYRAEND